MNAACNWDALPGGKSDCEKECAPGCRSDQLGNGICEPNCARAECNWDYRDCECANVLDTCEGSETDGSDRKVEYAANTRKCWLIRPKRANTRVTLSWERFNTELEYDHVIVYDGKSELDPKLSPSNGFSGSSLPADVTSSGGEMLIQFMSDEWDSWWSHQNGKWWSHITPARES